MVCHLISNNREIVSKIMFLWKKKYYKDIAVLWLQHDLVIGPKIRPVNVSKFADFLFILNNFVALRRNQTILLLYSYRSKTCR